MKDVRGLGRREMENLNVLKKKKSLFTLVLNQNCIIAQIRA